MTLCLWRNLCFVKKAVYNQNTGSFSILHPELGDTPIGFDIIASAARLFHAKMVTDTPAFTAKFRGRINHKGAQRGAKGLDAKMVTDTPATV
jgi:hypothetical protein